jgi:[ribosomal protein S5]-alanine N-acetyltransferase
VINTLLPIVGIKVLIRKLNEKDLESLYALEIDDHVKRYVGGPVTTPQQEWIEGMAGLCSTPNAALPLIVIYKVSGDFAGRASLSPVPLSRSWEIQVLIAKKYWSQRLGREVTELLMGVAIDDLKASSVVAIVDPKNEASLTLAKDLGFTMSRRSNLTDGTMDTMCSSVNLECCRRASKIKSSLIFKEFLVAQIRRGTFRRLRPGCYLMMSATAPCRPDDPRR